MKLDWARIAKIFACVASGLIAALLGKDWIVGNNDAVSLIATIFSVLAGFLVAVMALIADDRFVRYRGNRFLHFDSKNVRSRLIRHKLLFQLYLVIMLLAFIVTLKLGIPTKASDVLHQVMLGLSVSAFLLSFSLPSQITAEYLRKLAEVENNSGT